MNYPDIKNFVERCNSHPDHQQGMITDFMLKERLHEEVQELRSYIDEIENLLIAGSEIKRLTNCLRKANEQIERYEAMT